MTFPPTDRESGVLDVKIQTASVDTGSGMKDGKLKGKDIFDVENDPVITFHSNQVVQTGPTIFDVQGTFTNPGVSKPETLNLAISGEGTGSGEINGRSSASAGPTGIQGIQAMARGISPLHNPSRLRIYGERTPHPPAAWRLRRQQP